MMFGFTCTFSRASLRTSTVHLYGKSGEGEEKRVSVYTCIILRGPESSSVSFGMASACIQYIHVNWYQLSILQEGQVWDKVMHGWMLLAMDNYYVW